MTSENIRQRGTIGQQPDYSARVKTVELGTEYFETTRAIDVLFVSQPICADRMREPTSAAGSPVQRCSWRRTSARAGRRLHCGATEHSRSDHRYRECRGLSDGPDSLA